MGQLRLASKADFGQLQQKTKDVATNADLPGLTKLTHRRDNLFLGEVNGIVNWILDLITLIQGCCGVIAVREKILYVFILDGHLKAFILWNMCRMPWACLLASLR